MISKLFLIAIAPAISIAIAVYITDRYDKEPISLLVKTFILGALSVIPILVVEKLLVRFNIFTGLLGVFYVSFIVAGFTEEYFKRSVITNFIYRNKNYNEKLDGIIYCVFASLGFATIENIVYVVYRFNYNAYVGLYRGILSVPAHCIFAVSMGYYLSLAKFSNDKTKVKSYLRKSLYIPIILHGTFNFILMSDMPYYNILFIPYVLYLWRSSKKKLDEYVLDSKHNSDDLN